jgi:hypothetical protein
MNKLILLVVGAAWAAVLLPPLLRSRLDSRPGTSITSFRRQLSTLQRSVPGTVAPMRSMARPLSGPTRHGYAPGYQQVQGPALRRTGTGTVVQMDRSYRLDQPMARRTGHQHHVAIARSSAKQRRQNVLLILGMSTAAFLFLTLATTAEFARYGLAISLCMLIGYVYLLVQIRQNELARTRRATWQHAA